MSKISESLLQAYLATSYEADLPNGRIALRIGEHSPVLDKLMRKNGYQSWAFVTAFNPGSQSLSEDENRTRHQQLQLDIQTQDLPFFHGAGCPAKGDWQPELSLLILGISYDNARILGRRYEQLAIVTGDLGGRAQLVFCTTAKQSTP